MCICEINEAQTSRTKLEIRKNKHSKQVAQLDSNGIESEIGLHFRLVGEILILACAKLELATRKRRLVAS